jgi:hypothetical protein
MSSSSLDTPLLPFATVHYPYDDENEEQVDSYQSSFSFYSRLSYKPFSGNDKRRQTTLSTFVQRTVIPLQYSVEVFELDGSSHLISYSGILPAPSFRIAILEYLRQTLKRHDSRLFRVIEDEKIVHLNFDAKMKHGVNIVYAFLPVGPKFPDFFQDIVPRLLDMNYGSDIAPLLNTCSQARIAPLKSNGLTNWQYDITYRSWKDSKWKCNSASALVRKDNWLHLHYIASYKAKNKKKMQFFHDHNIDKLFCNHGEYGEQDNPSYLLHCKCGRKTVCIDCEDNGDGDDFFIMCSKCKKYTCGEKKCGGTFCEIGLNEGGGRGCVSYLCDACERLEPFSSCSTACKPCRESRPGEFFSCLTCSLIKCNGPECLKIKCAALGCSTGLCVDCFRLGIRQQQLRQTFGWQVPLPGYGGLNLCAPHVLLDALAMEERRKAAVAAVEANRLAVIADTETKRLAVIADTETKRLAIIADAESARLAAIAAEEKARSRAILSLIEEKEKEEEEEDYIYSPEQ